MAEPMSWDFLGNPVVHTLLPLQGAQIQSLVRKLEYWMLHPKNKNKLKNKAHILVHPAF